MRNENGYGCLVKLSGKRRKQYAVRITTGWKDGKQQRKYLGYYETQADALIALADFHKRGAKLDVSNLTLQDTWKRWIERVEKKDLSKSVLATHLAVHNRLGNLLKMKMNDIKTVHLQDWLDNLDVKPSTKGKFKSTLNQVFKYAIKNDIVDKNYAEFLEISEKIEKTGAVFTPEEIELLWSKKDDDWVQLILILIYTGMRIGELLAIKVDDIHFDHNYIIGGNKTEAGIDRVIPLHDKIVPFVKNQIEGKKWLVQNDRGSAYSYTNASKYIKGVFTKLGFNHKIHDTRKTAISIMHTSGIPMETIRVIVGHSGKGVTEKVYLYKDAKELVEVINTMEIPF